MSENQNQQDTTIDHSTFMSQTVTEANDTINTVIPECETEAFIEDLKFRSSVSPKNGNTYNFLDVTWNITSEDLLKETGRDKNICRQSLFVDLLPSGALDMGKGKNVDLGRLRESVGQNKKGKSWSPGMLIGAAAIVKIEHEMYRGQPSAKVVASRVIG